MLNYLWSAMLILGVVWGVLSGNPAQLTDGILTGAKDAVSLCITMAGVMAFWCGMMEVAQKAGVIGKITRLLRHFVGFLFPRIPDGHPAQDDISANIAANVMGLGWAATPAGLKAMESLAELEAERGTPGYEEFQERGGKPVREGMSGKGKRQERNDRNSGNIGNAKKLAIGYSGQLERRASTEMCTFLILNISSLQLIPVNMIAYRSQYGSANPAAIVGPAIIATAVSTAAAVIYCKWKGRGKTEWKLTGGLEFEKRNKNK